MHELEGKNPPVVAPRLPVIDALRGFALFGVFGANLMIFSGWSYMNEEQRTRVASTFLDELIVWLQLFFVENKFMGLFSLLFGISFWLFLDRAHARGGTPYLLFYRRIGWLFLFGVLHGLLWCFDILRFYALWALLLPLFVRVPPRRLLGLALFTALVAPALVAGLRGWLPPPMEGGIDYDQLALTAFASGDFPRVLAANLQYDWYLTNSIGQIGYQLGVFGRLLLGLYAARALDLGNLGSHRVALSRVLIGGAVLGVVGNAVFVSEVGSGARGFLLPFLRRLLVEAGYLGFTLAFSVGVALLFGAARWQGVVASLAPLGRMALSAYLLQTFFGIWLFYGFAPGPQLMGKVGPAQLALIWVSLFVVQVLVARAWMQRFRFGPMEWLWRTLTYWRLQPLRSAAPVSA